MISHNKIKLHFVKLMKSDFPKVITQFSSNIESAITGSLSALTPMAGLVLLGAPGGDGQVSVGAQLGPSAPAAAGDGQTWD